MQPPFQGKEIRGSIVAPRGFLAGAVFCDIKRLGTGKGSDKGRKLDLALILSQKPAAAAGLFTTNQVCAAPVKVCLERVPQAKARAIVVNSGNANACTGLQGLRHARSMASLAARELGVPASSVLVGSTGRIGVPLPMGNVRSGIERAAGLLGSEHRHADAAAEAILTSDTRTKQIAVDFELEGKPVRIGGICKGAGMIQPRMCSNGKRAKPLPGRASSNSGLHATMLCFLTSDAEIEPAALQMALESAVERSFNRITVDGDMSTNDTVLLLANGLAGNRRIGVREVRQALRAHPASRSGKPKPSRAAAFVAALDHVCLELAKMIVRDGEGVSRFVTLRVSGARNAAEAEAVARAVANSALVKTSWCGGDPNWGRIIDAAGYSEARVVEGKVDIGYSKPGSGNIVWSLRRGQPAATSFQRLCAAVAPREFDLHLRLNLGKGQTVLYAADLTEAYVDFNKGNVSDPGSLGG